MVSHLYIECYFKAVHPLFAEESTSCDFAVKGKTPQKREPQSETDTECRASKASRLGGGYATSGRMCSRAWRFPKASLRYYGIATGRRGGRHAVAEGTEPVLPNKRGAGKQSAQGQIHLPNSSPESKERKTVSMTC